MPVKIASGKVFNVGVLTDGAASTSCWWSSCADKTPTTAMVSEFENCPSSLRVRHFCHSALTTFRSNSPARSSALALISSSTHSGRSAPMNESACGARQGRLGRLRISSVTRPLEQPEPGHGALGVAGEPAPFDGTGEEADQGEAARRRDRRSRHVALLAHLELRGRLHFDFVTVAQHVKRVRNASLAHRRDVNQAIDAGHQFDERAELLQANDLALHRLALFELAQSGGERVFHQLAHRQV